MTAEDRERAAGERCTELIAHGGEDWQKHQLDSTACPWCFADAIRAAEVAVLEHVAGMATKQAQGLSRNPRMALLGHARAVRKLAAELGDG